MNDTSTDWLDEPVKELVTESDYELYVKLCSAKRKIESQLEELRQKLLLQGTDWRHETDRLGVIICYETKYYGYSPEAREEIKKIQENDIKTGKAKEKTKTTVKHIKPQGL